jgi:hypothetical protein
MSDTPRLAYRTIVREVVPEGEIIYHYRRAVYGKPTLADRGGPWLTTRAVCGYCGWAWVAVVQWGTRGKECPRCIRCNTAFEWEWL